MVVSGTERPSSQPHLSTTIYRPLLSLAGFGLTSLFPPLPPLLLPSPCLWDPITPAMSAPKEDVISVRSDEKAPLPSPDASDVEFATFGTSVQFSKEEEDALVRKFGSSTSSLDTSNRPDLRPRLAHHAFGHHPVLVQLHRPNQHRKCQSRRP